MAMPGRTHAVGGHKYKYGFNGKELDDEIAEGDYDFDERMYDSRIGRFFSTDPCEEDYPSFSPYCFAANNPILFVDVDGCGPGNPWLEVLSVALDFVPVVGTVKNLVEAAVGYDLAGNKLEAWERIAMIVPGGALANKAFKAGKAVVKQVLKHSDDIARISKKVFTKVVENGKKITSAVDDAFDYVKRNLNDGSSWQNGNKYEEMMFEKFKKRYEKKGYSVEKEVSTKNFDGSKGATLDGVAVKFDKDGNISKMKIVEFKTGKSGSRNKGWSKQQLRGRDNGGIFTAGKSKFDGKLKGKTYESHSIKRQRNFKVGNLFGRAKARYTKRRGGKVVRLKHKM